MNDATLLEIARNGSGYGVWTLVIIAVITLIKGWPALRKLAVEADGSLRRDLLDRIHALESDLDTERKASAEERRVCAEKLEELRQEIIGLHRQMAQYQLRTVENLPPATKKSLDRRDGPEGK